MRSYLIFPADKDKYISKALISNADVLIFDLEDSVKGSNKNYARKNLRKKVNNIKNKTKKVYVRVNSSNLKIFTKDIISCNLKNVDGFLIPKCECGNNLSKQINIIKKNFRNNFELLLLIESHKGILNLEKILSKKNLKYIDALMFGHEDFSASILKYFSEDFSFYKNFRHTILLHAKSNNLLALDTPTLEMSSKKKISDYFKLSFKDGFDGALIIHPNQINLANKNYTPSVRDLNYSIQITKLSKKLNSIFAYKKKFIGPPIIKRALNIKKRYDQITSFKKKNL
jgi:citrate lyase beta subunit